MLLGKESSLFFIYNLMCQLEPFLLFVKFLLKLLILKINQGHQYHYRYHVLETFKIKT
jgi:hypothetical protein